MDKMWITKNYTLVIYIFKIQKLQFCRVRGGSTAVTAKLNCTHCRSTSLQPNFNSWVGGGGGSTAVTAKLNCIHCRSTSLQPGFDCSHCKVELHSLQINFTSVQLQLLGGWVGGGLTADTAKLNCTHCRSTSLQPNFNSWVGGGGGFDCSHCKVELHSLQINFSSAQLQLLGGGGGFNCSHCKVEQHSLQINFTSAQLQLLGGGV